MTVTIRLTNARDGSVIATRTRPARATAIGIANEANAAVTDRGFFGRAADEIGSWFGNDDDHRGDRQEYRGADREEHRHQGSGERHESRDRGYRP